VLSLWEGDWGSHNCKYCVTCIILKRGSHAMRDKGRVLLVPKHVRHLESWKRGSLWRHRNYPYKGRVLHMPKYVILLTFLVPVFSLPVRTLLFFARYACPNMSAILNHESEVPYYVILKWVGSCAWPFATTATTATTATL